MIQSSSYLSHFVIFGHFLFKRKDLVSDPVTGSGWGYQPHSDFDVWLSHGAGSRGIHLVAGPVTQWFGWFGTGRPGRPGGPKADRYQGGTCWRWCNASRFTGKFFSTTALGIQRHSTSCKGWGFHFSVMFVGSDVSTLPRMFHWFPFGPGRRPCGRPVGTGKSQWTLPRQLGKPSKSASQCWGVATGW